MLPRCKTDPGLLEELQPEPSFMLAALNSIVGLLGNHPRSALSAGKVFSCRCLDCWWSKGNTNSVETFIGREQSILSEFNSHEFTEGFNLLALCLRNDHEQKSGVDGSHTQIA